MVIEKRDMEGMRRGGVAGTYEGPVIYSARARAADR